MPKAKKLPSGSWRVRVYDGKTAEGKPIYKSFTADTKKQAEFLAAEYLAGKKRKQPDDRSLADAYKRYIEIKSNTLSPTTVREYTKAAGRDFPELMPLKLSQITQEAVQSAVNVMSANHSPKSVRNAHGLLSAVLRMFAPDIRLNTRMPQKKKTEIYVPTEAEVEHLIRSIKGTELLKAILLAAFGSLRRSEVCALDDADLDRNGSIIHVRKAMVWAITKEWIIKQPKSKAGYREVTMPPFVMDALSPAEGTHRIVNLVPTTITNRFSKALESVGLPHFRYHDLRHYQASILHAMGVPDKYIMERGGWKTDSTLKNIYQHTMSDKRKEVEADIVKKFEESHRKYDTNHDMNI